MKNGPDSLLVFSQNGQLARLALRQLMVECIHGAKLPGFFWAQCYVSQKTF
jgi:hypothetical protein